MSTFAVITKDELSPLTGPYAEDNIEGRYLTTNHVRPENVVHFRLLDDDRIPYFEGVATDDDELLEAILRHFMGGYGCTILQLKDELNGYAWVDYMN